MALPSQNEIWQVAREVLGVDAAQCVWNRISVPALALAVGADLATAGSDAGAATIAYLQPHVMACVGQKGVELLGKIAALFGGPGKVPLSQGPSYQTTINGVPQVQGGWATGGGLTFGDTAVGFVPQKKTVATAGKKTVATAGKVGGVPVALLALLALVVIAAK